MFLITIEISILNQSITSLFILKNKYLDNKNYEYVL
jgi:hypothetical protein